MEHDESFHFTDNQELVVKTTHRRLFALLFSCVFVVPCCAFAQATPDLTTPPDSTEVAASGNLPAPAPDSADLPSAPVPNNVQTQSTPQDQSQQGQSQQTTTNQKTPPQTNEPTLQDLGISTAQTQGSAQQQAMLDKRTHMLKVHQTLGLITAIPMVAALITGPQAKAKGKTGETITEPTSTNLDAHIALGGLTTGLYWTTAYYAIFAPKVSGVKPKGAIRLHRDLEYVHGPGMILTPILGIMAYKQENAGEKVHGIASYHGTAAYVTAAAYGAAIVSVSWPIHLKFWEK